MLKRAGVEVWRMVDVGEGGDGMRQKGDRGKGN